MNQQSMTRSEAEEKNDWGAKARANGVVIETVKPEHYIAVGKIDEEGFGSKKCCLCFSG